MQHFSGRKALTVPIQQRTWKTTVLSHITQLSGGLSGYFLKLARCNTKQNIVPLEESQGQLRSSEASRTVLKTSSECFMAPKDQAIQLQLLFAEHIEDVIN